MPNQILPDQNQMKIFIRCCLFFLVVVGLIGWFTTPICLEFVTRKDSPTMLGYFVSMLGCLFLVSLFVERVIEVILSMLRSKKADELDSEIDNKKRRIKEGIESCAGQQDDADQDRGAIKKLEELEETRTTYRAVSRSIAQWFGLCIGVLVSIVGVRVLGNIVDISSLTKMQKEAFSVVDIMLTGTVLAGGSDAINKIMKVYGSIMSSTEKKSRIS